MTTEKASGLGHPAIARPGEDDSTQLIENLQEPQIRRTSSPPRDEIPEAAQFMETERADAPSRPTPMANMATEEVEYRVEDATMVLDSNRFNDSPGENTAKQSFGPNHAQGPSDPK